MSYGQSGYGLLLYGQEAAPDIDEDHLEAPDLMPYLPYYYGNSRIMRSIQSANAKELAKLRFTLDEILKQLFVDTATWGLDLWEKELGLATDPVKPYVRRRELIKTKIRGAGTITRQMIIEAAAAFSGGEVDVVEYPEEHRFEIVFIGVLGIPPNMPGLIQMLDEIKPAHLIYTFKYTYTWWDDLKSLTWNQASAKTWNDLKLYRGA